MNMNEGGAQSIKLTRKNYGDLTERVRCAEDTTHPQEQRGSHGKSKMRRG